MSGDDFELSRVIERLNQCPAGSFANILQLYTSFDNQTISTPSIRVIRLLRDLFIDGVNRRLQNDVYRKYFLANPPSPNESHDQKIAALEATRAEAQKILHSYDWDWLVEWLQLERIGENSHSCVRRLSNFAFPIQRVNFRFTYHCNIACRHCYNNSGPDLKAQKIPLEPMLSIISQMPGAGIGNLNLTGGEPFLYPDHLTALVTAARAARLRTVSIYTNGFWALNAERAKQTLGRLSAAGFMQGPGDHIKVSTGVYHQEFLEFGRALTLAGVYHSMFGKRLRIDFELAPGGDDIIEQVRQRVSGEGLADRVVISFRKVSPVGRGKQLESLVTHSIDYPCNSINQIVFDPDGSARPCCGMNNENKGVVIGELKRHRLSDLVKRMQNDPILQFLAKNPMNAVFEHLEKLPDSNGYTDTCQLCQAAIGDLDRKETLQAKLFDNQEFYPFWFGLNKEWRAAACADALSDEIG